MENMTYLSESCFEGKNILTGLLYGHRAIPFQNEIRFFSDEERHQTTAMHFPSKITEEKEKQAQKLNYDYFIYTMADLMKKYAPEITDL